MTTEKKTSSRISDAPTVLEGGSRSSECCGDGVWLSVDLATVGTAEGWRVVCAADDVSGMGILRCAMMSDMLASIPDMREARFVSDAKWVTRLDGDLGSSLLPPDTSLTTSVAAFRFRVPFSRAISFSISSRLGDR